ncbi:sodium:calcium antiporter [Martelella lutilitoris]|uniref:Sodium:calcium antiporter n=1 Tax=Martelella lutilitoris TaxID=2583532 RepID=A0A5C4JSG3_9HYPH|nr:sodium:calcium antiporter [Martelella lutilitoris]TNB48217.1 sodium:calcium antiporter [Martelella lutilitoris]
MSFENLSLVWLVAIFAGAGLIILACGVRITDVADRIADRTGLGEALIGGLLLGAATSLSGTVVSITTAFEGRASLSFSNAVGGIAAQTAFLALADMIYRRVNLEHAAADLSNLFQGALLVLLLSIPLIAYVSPDISFFAVSPFSLILFGIYIAGVVASKRVRDDPMWRPVGTRETRTDTPDEEQKDARGNVAIFAVFGALMLLMGIAGYAISGVAGVLTDRYGLSASLVGALMTAVVTSLPELVTTLAAVRRGALQLAVGGIIGGNTFDTLFLTLSDVAYRDGSLYHAINKDDLVWLSVGLSATAILLLGLIVRQKAGPGRIGFESAGILALYAGAVALTVS